MNEIVERERYLSCMYKDLGFASYAKSDMSKALEFLQEAMVHFNALSNEIKNENIISDEEFLQNLISDIQKTKSLIAEILIYFADTEFKNKNFDKALNIYKDVLYYDITKSDVFSHIATCLDFKGADLAAADFLEKAISLNPDNSVLYSFLAYIYGYKLNNYKKSIEFFEKYIDKNPNDAYAYNSLGHINEKCYKYENTEEQIRLFQHALALKPDFAGAIRNLAITYPRVGKYDDAIRCYKRLFELEDLPDDYYSYACLQIQLGNFDEGWKYFSKRFEKKFDTTSYPKIEKPLWNGEKILDKTLLVNFEQGYGDTIQFFRYIPLLKEYAGKIILRVQNPLVSLLKINTDVEVVGDAKSIDDIEFDYHVPMMNLPAIFDMNKTNIPFADGFLKADDAKVKIFKKEIFNNDCLKVGISWHGSKIGNEKRNIPLECFKPLLNKENCKIYSFQKGTTTKELSALSVDVYNLGNVFSDFSDTAAAIENLDVLVTSDNSIVHVAGALGKKTILLLNKDSEWRWFFDEDKTPWYDSVKIIKKQNENDSWESLIEKASLFI